jgi:hypothetical protein
MHVNQFAGPARNRRLTVGLCVAAAMLLGIFVNPVAPVEAQVVDRTAPLYFTRFFFVPSICGSFIPPEECLSLGSPSGDAPATAASSPLTRADGNEFQSLGVWSIKRSTFRQHLGLPEDDSRRVLTVSLTSADLWLGLVSSADTAAKFDIEIVGLGVAHCISLSTTNATRISIPVQSAVPVYTGGGALDDAELFLRVSARMGTNEDNSPCAGSSTASGVQIFYDADAVASRVTVRAHEEPEPEPAFFVFSAPPGVTPVPVPPNPAFKCTSADLMSGCLAAAEPRHDDTHYFETGPIALGPGWTTLGTWKDERPFEIGITPIIGLSDLDLFLGLKKTADIAARFDILATVRIVRADGSDIVSTGLVRCVGGLDVGGFGRNEAGGQMTRNAGRVTVPLSPLPAALPAGLGISEVKLTVQVRRGTLADDSPCGGPTRFDGLRVFFGEEAPAAFQFVAHARATAEVFLVNRPGIPSDLGTRIPVTPTQSADSPALGFSKGNPWKDIGNWSGALDLGTTEVVGVSPLRVWVGLKNSDDVGTRFDLRAILRFAANGESREVVGIARCIRGVPRDPAAAGEVFIEFPEFAELYLAGPSSVLQIVQLRISARIGTTEAGAFCGGHASAQGLRLYFGSPSRPAGFAFVLEEGDEY